MLRGGQTVQKTSCTMSSGGGFQVAEWVSVGTIKEESLVALDVVPLCIKIVDYTSQPPRNLWANRTHLQLISTSLEAFRAQV